ncbi:GNAT family N-acetyltransferase [Candidatus Beckwithbacteria bacterium]|nr:GNAT family N-acetyltransferase [Candidatus Beckwithbacteria bacterium]
MRYVFKLENKISSFEFSRLEDLLVPLFSFSYHFSKSYHGNHVLYFSSKPKWRLFLYDKNTLIGSLSIVERKIHTPFQLSIAGIGNLGIKPSYQAKGLAMSMLEHAHHFAKKQGMNISLLFCIPEKSNLYVKTGYAKLERPVFYEDNSETKMELLSYAYPLSIDKKKFDQIVNRELNIGKGSW